MRKIKSFEDLDAWKEGHKLVLMIYGLVKKFPKEEKYALGDQLRRSVVSVTSNISEGFSRQTKKEKVQFFHMALGSLSEVQNQILISRDIGYMNVMEFDKIKGQTVIVSKLLNGLIKFLRK